MLRLRQLVAAGLRWRSTVHVWAAKGTQSSLAVFEKTPCCRRRHRVAPERGEVAIADVPPQQTAASSATERPSSLIKRYATLWQQRQSGGSAGRISGSDALYDISIRTCTYDRRPLVRDFGMTTHPLAAPRGPRSRALCRCPLSRKRKRPATACDDPDHSPSTEEKMSRSQAPPSILDRPLGRPASSSGGRGSSGSGDGVSLSAFAYLYSELVQYHQSRVASISELERRLESAGYGVGLRVLELLAYRAREVRLWWRSWAGLLVDT